MATSLAAAGVPLPSGAGPDSVDQLPVLLGERNEVRREMVYQGVLGFALRQGPWVYIPSQGSQGFTAAADRSFGVPFRQMGFRNNFLDADGVPLANAPPAQLYHIQDDVSQERNVVLEHPAVAREMAARLNKILGPNPRNIGRPPNPGSR